VQARLSVSLYFAGDSDGKSNHPQRRKRIDDIKKVPRDIDKNISSNINEI
jgi:hypothetical protein